MKKCILLPRVLLVLLAISTIGTWIQLPAFAAEKDELKSQEWLPNKSTKANPMEPFIDHSELSVSQITSKSNTHSLPSSFDLRDKIV